MRGVRYWAMVSGCALLGLGLGQAVAADSPGTGASATDNVKPKLGLSVQVGTGMMVVRIRPQNLVTGEQPIFVYRVPGNQPCLHDPREQFPRGAQQLHFGLNRRPDRISPTGWDPAIAVPVVNRRTWTVCGYISSDSGWKNEVDFGATDAYVLDRSRQVVRTRPGRVTRGVWAPAKHRCAVEKKPRSLPYWYRDLRSRDATPAGCQRARTIARGWVTTYFNQHGGTRGDRNNLFMGLPGPLPTVGFSRLPRVAGGVNCRERVTGTVRRDTITYQVREMLCGGVSFRSPV